MLKLFKITDASNVGVDTPKQVYIGKVYPGDELFDSLERGSAILVHASHFEGLIM